MSDVGNTPEELAANFPAEGYVQSDDNAEVSHLDEKLKLEAQLAALQSGIDQNASNLSSALNPGTSDPSTSDPSSIDGLPEVMEVEDPTDPFEEEWDVEEMNERHAEYIQGVEAAARKVEEAGTEPRMTNDNPGLDLTAGVDGARGNI